MTSKDIGEAVRVAQEDARLHAQQCTALLTEDRLGDALQYCRAQGIDPPKCSLTANSVNANRLRVMAKGMLSDEAWWKKRLKVVALRDYEYATMMEGRVTNAVSDEMIAYIESGNRFK